MSNIMSGTKVANSVKAKLKIDIAKLKTKPQLVVISVGDDPASKVYMRSKERACAEVGIDYVNLQFKPSTDEEVILSEIKLLNANPVVTGIIVQLPLPQHMSETNIAQSIVVEKDVDGFHPQNLGLLCNRSEALEPCTPKGVMTLLEEYKVATRGVHAVVVGASNIVGRPVMLELLKADATVTICNSKTKNLPSFVKQADILVVAVGKPKFIKAEWLKSGATVIDVGINRLDNGKLCGDVDFEEAKKVAKWITPVPKGVGVMTVAMLMENTYEAYIKHHS